MKVQFRASYEQFGKIGLLMQLALFDLELSVQSRLRSFTAERFNSRLWDKNCSVWSDDPVVASQIQNSLGWLNLDEKMLPKIPELEQFAASCKNDRFTDLLLLGMGGSSLCPEVLRQVFSGTSTGLKLTVLDSTDPEQIQKIEKALPLEKTLVIVSSKSGTTLEVDALYQYFRPKISNPSQWIAITDDGTPLHARAKQENFRKIFIAPSDVGGRFSALSYFGLVPAALMGIDLNLLLRSASDISSITGPTISDTENVALILGAFLGEGFDASRNKLTIVSSSELQALGLWVEQLVAESTGKGNRGILPSIETDPNPKELGSFHDRIFVIQKLQNGKDNLRINQWVHELHSRSLPYVVLEIKKKEEIGGLFLWWELATAVAGSLMVVQPFDQPNVQESKAKTQALINQKKFTPDSTFPLKDLPRILKETVAGDYVSILGFLPYHAETTLDQIRRTIQKNFKRVCTIGFGPRYLHSTGQLHKGDAGKGVFILLTRKSSSSLPIPGGPLSFQELEMAQALGDLEALKGRGRRVFHIHLGEDWETELKDLHSVLEKVVSIPVIT